MWEAVFEILCVQVFDLILINHYCFHVAHTHTLVISSSINPWDMKGVVIAVQQAIPDKNYFVPGEFYLKSVQRAAEER